MSSEEANEALQEGPRFARLRIVVWGGGGRRGLRICLLLGGGYYWTETPCFEAILALHEDAHISP